ncbi:MAG: hypothetical protein AAFY56_23830, partial [Pseudomonadota bacterium]
HDLSFTLAELAEVASVPIEVAHARFPVEEAALTGLAKHYVRQLGSKIGAGHRDRDGENWEGIVSEVLRRGRAYYHAHPVAMKLRLGVGIPAGARLVYLESLSALAQMLNDEANRLFVLPERTDITDELAEAIYISDALWSLSVMRHGFISDHAAETAERAAAAYLEPLLGKRLKRRVA